MESQSMSQEHCNIMSRNKVYPTSAFSRKVIQAHRKIIKDIVTSGTVKPSNTTKCMRSPFCLPTWCCLLVWNVMAYSVIRCLNVCKCKLYSSKHISESIQYYLAKVSSPCDDDLEYTSYSSTISRYENWLHTDDGKYTLCTLIQNYMTAIDDQLEYNRFAKDRAMKVYLLGDIILDLFELYSKIHVNHSIGLSRFIEDSKSGYIDYDILRKYCESLV